VDETSDLWRTGWHQTYWRYISLWNSLCNVHGITYLLTPWCRVLLEKLTGLQLVKKFPPFHGTRRFITALTSVRHLSLSWVSPIQSTFPHPTSWRSILILSTHLRLGLPSGLLPSLFAILKPINAVLIVGLHVRNYYHRSLSWIPPCASSKQTRSVKKSLTIIPSSVYRCPEWSFFMRFWN